MKRSQVKGKSALFVLLFACVVLSFNAEATAAAANRKIVVFQEEFVNEAAREALMAQFGAESLKSLPLVNGRAVLLPPQAEKALLGHPGVLRIDEDLIVYANKPGGGKKPAPEPPPQPTQEELWEDLWGIQRIGSPKAWDATMGGGVGVAVVDTGIDLNHPDLADNYAEGYNAINARKQPKDDNGHGTHVAGIIAGVDNEIGVVGVGPEISLYAVKVLRSQGWGFLSDIIDGLGWCAEAYPAVRVVNMSFGGSDGNQSYEDAIQAAYDAGLVLVAAAGNNGEYGGAIDYPAKYAQTIAVSAIDESDQLASFSSFGAEVDLAAPGVDILSCYPDDWYAWGSGTSSAAPHVSGVAALVLAIDSGLSNDAVRSILESEAEDIGESGEDDDFGCGLVDAAGAVAAAESALAVGLAE
jgi:subtilisin family serine protease